jgi:endonuclease/exonuclease/phosphatase family metal-dependent hydrolase
MRVATFNVENLFSRVRAMATDDPAKSKIVLEDVAELQGLIEQPSYSEADKALMLKLLRKHNALGDTGPIFLQETRKRLVWKGKIIAEGRNEWVGWIEWRRSLIENPAFGYPHAMLIDGNDERGIDVGLLSRYPVTDMRSHVDDPDPDTGKPVFSRDCAEYEIDLPGNKNLWIICNHFKSRGYGSKEDNDRKRRRQTERAAAILKRFNLASAWVIVAGDFNELPSSDSLAPLLQHAGLHNAFEKLSAGEDRWTHRDDAVPSKNNQIDYLLVSDALWPHLQEVGINRRGIWSKTKKVRDKYPPLQTVTGDTNAASDHAPVWAEFAL